ncbi:MAG: YihY/virulence factor BrkB family protein [Anaerolineae bacterium]|nr:YihY/virulence factor BrkB family protein [Anaerolineae bacterium]
MNSTWQIVKRTTQQWMNDNIQTQAAAVAYFAIFSLAPLLVLAIALAGVVFGEQAAQGELVGQIEEVIGTEGAEAVQALIEGASTSDSGLIATLVSVGFLAVAALRVFTQLQQSLNTIWEVEPVQSGGLIDPHMLRKRLFSFGLVLLMGGLLVVLIIVNSLLPVAYSFLDNVVPGVQVLSQGVSILVLAGLMTVFFALVYKILPDAQIEWRDVWLGAFVTSVLIIIGNVFIGLYLRYSGTVSAFGAAGSFIALMLWIYYSSLVAFFGAEFTQVYATHHGRDIQPDEHAVSTRRSAPAERAEPESIGAGA